MAKFCSNCGSPLDEGVAFCSNCGSPVAAEPAAAPQPSAATATAAAATAVVAASAKKVKSAVSGLNSSKKIVVAVLCAVLAIVLLVAVVNVISGFTGYTGTLNKLFKGLKNYDMDTLYSITSPISDEIYGSYLGKDVDKQYDRWVSNTLDKYEDSVGNISKISYEITDETELSDRKMAEIKEDLEESYHYDASGIKKIISVDLRISVKGAKKSATFFVSELYLIKEDGKWTVLYRD